MATMASGFCRCLAQLQQLEQVTSLGKPDGPEPDAPDRVQAGRVPLSQAQGNMQQNYHSTEP